jgi:hypothetical protein
LGSRPPTGLTNSGCVVSTGWRPVLPREGKIGAVARCCQIGNWLDCFWLKRRWKLYAAPAMVAMIHLGRREGRHDTGANGWRWSTRVNISLVRLEAKKFREHNSLPGLIGGTSKKKGK